MAGRAIDAAVGGRRAPAADDRPRPPAAVELAAYRVAQEALVNALKHGAAPISVSYRATSAGVTLSVDDAGPGIDRDALTRAERDGRLGIASMAQRAEAIGARLVLGARPAGGTHVGLEWLAHGPDMTRIRVAIVDDHPALREGTATLLAREPDIEVVATLGYAGRDPGAHRLATIRPMSSSRTSASARRAGCGCWVATARSRAIPSSGRPRPAIILWTAYDYPQYAAYAYRAGAAGFVVKTAPTAELIEAIRRVAAGGLHFSSRPDLGTLALSGREREVLERVVEGRTNDEIGGDLSITTRTVEAHLTRLYERFDVRSRTELATRAVREGWLDVPTT